MIIEYAETLKIAQEESSEWQERINRINNKLSEYYYKKCVSKTLLVGSVGRGTAITKTSDYDVIFILPQETYARFDNYGTNGQSALLQEVRAVISGLYTSTDIKADGQVVDVNFANGTIELVPAFEQSDKNFKFPDSHDGGSWKVTKPMLEIDKAKSMGKNNSDIYNCLCRLMRQWKNYSGFSFKGLLIDTMVCNYLESDNNYSEKSELELLRGLFEYLSQENKDNSYWLALGSNQQIDNDDNGKFIYKASQALKEFDNGGNEEKVLNNLFGRSQAKSKAPEEEFVESKFGAIDIRYNIKIDCDVTQDGWQTRKLTYYLERKWLLMNDKTLDFMIMASNIPHGLPVKYHWKIRNVGSCSIGRERGQIIEGKKRHKEHSDFNGNHYVECYAVLNNVVIAKDRIDVPIDVENGV